MNLVEIKERYKQILEEPESQHSEDEWQIAYSRMKNKRRRHVLTESHCQNLPSQELTDESAVLKLKQKLAQCLSNLNQKDKQIASLQKLTTKYQQKLSESQQQISQLKQALTNQQQLIIQNKIAYGCIQKDYSSLTKIIQSNKLDKQLSNKQIQYFQEEIQQYKKEIGQKKMEIQGLEGTIKSYEQYKHVNMKLKVDLERLKYLLAETDKYRIFATEIQLKHYLGQPSKEHQCWFSGDMILEIEKFIKKYKISSNNYSHKELTSILVKFIAKYTENEKKKVQKKAKRQFNSRIKQIQRKQNHSLNYMEVRGETLRKSLLKNSLCRSIRSHVMNQSKKCTQSFIYDRLQKSLATHQFHQNHQSRDLCVQMLGSFRKGIVELISSRKIVTKKIIKLVDWMIQGILSIFPKQKASGQIVLQADQIKICQ